MRRRARNVSLWRATGSRLHWARTATHPYRAPVRFRLAQRIVGESRGASWLFVWAWQVVDWRTESVYGAAAASLRAAKRASDHCARVLRRMTAWYGRCVLIREKLLTLEED